jgi:hypothetical protein
LNAERKKGEKNNKQHEIKGEKIKKRGTGVMVV